MSFTNKLSDSIINNNQLNKSANKSGAIRRKHSREFKFKVAIEAIREHKTIAMICREFAVHESQVNAWKKQLKEQGSIIFEDISSSVKINHKANKEAALEAKISKLNEYIGELSVENKFFKKKLNF